MENVILDGGLDLVRARPAVLPGFIRECLNYEVGWRRGYSRIDGWERFDGHISPSSTTGWVFEIPKISVSGTFTPPEGLTWGSGEDAELVQIEDADPNWRFFLVFRQGRKRPEYGDTVVGVKSGASFQLDGIDIGTLKTFPEFYSTHAEYLTNLDNFAAILRSEVRPVPGGGTIVGLHYHEDSLYAIRDVVNISVPLADVNVLVPGMYVYNAAGQVGEVVTVDTGTNNFHIAAVDDDGFELAQGDTIHIALTMRYEDGTGDLQKDTSMVGTVSTWAGDIGFISRRDGSFESDNALGVVALINGPDNVAVTIPELFEDTLDSANNFNATDVQFAPFTNATTADVSHSQAETAAMWRSTGSGWVAADSGRVLKFIQGTNDPKATTPVTGQKDAFPSFIEVASATAAADWSGDIQTLKVDGGEINASMSPTNILFSSKGSSDSIRVNDFKLGLRDEQTITGLSVVFKAREGTTSEGYASLSVLADTDDNGKRSLNLPRQAAPGVVQSIGGIGTQWTVEPHTPEQVNAAEFGFRFNALSSSGNTHASVDYIKARVHYSEVPGETLYLWDADGAIDIGTISVNDLVLQSGGWDGGTTIFDGSGVGYFRLKDWSLIDLPPNTEIWTGTGGQAGGGLPIALVDGDISQPALPGSLALDRNRSRYQMISYNFFATEEQNAIYGCSGAGPAFWYNGDVLDFILTGVEAEDDKPRHVAPHQHRLALGYKWGEVYVSAPGEPTNYDGVDFAATFGFGDKITGLMPTVGEVLAVFTESATHALSGAAGGEGSQSPQQKVINHKVGAIEYTVQSIGNRPIFASFRGIEVLETMDKFGDLFTAPLTYDVSPWLLERLQSAAGLEATDKSVVNSVVVRNKNQYRLFFADGYVLTLTYVGPEKVPQNTIQQYWFNSDREQYSRCFATASGVTTDGRDRAFYSSELRPDAPDAPAVRAVDGEELDYVYELDRGRSFDGGSIEAHFTLTHNFGQQQQAPMLTKRYQAIHIHGECAGFAGIRLARSVNYEDLDDPVLPYEDAYFGALSHPPEDVLKPKYSKGRLTARGFAVSFHIKHESSTEFPHNIQLVTFLDDNPTRLNK